MLEALAFLGALVALDVLAARYGRSSRDGEDWTRRGQHLVLGR